MELADHDALGPVDDERAELGEEREVTEVDLFLDDVLRTPVLDRDRGLLLLLLLRNGSSSSSSSRSQTMSLSVAFRGAA